MRIDSRLRSWMPVYFAGAALVPLLGGSYLMETLLSLHLYLIFVLSWDLFCGPTRETNFGHTFFVGGAGYLSAWLQTQKALSPWICTLVALTAATAAGVFLGWIAHRAQGPTFALVTMSFQLMLYQAVFLFTDVFGGEEGILEIEPLVASGSGRFYLVLTAAAAVAALRSVLRESRWGLLLEALGQDEELARSSGVRTMRLKVAAFGLSAVLGALGGVLYAHTQGQINAEMVGSALAVQVVLLALVGGRRSGPAFIVLTFFLLQRLMSGVVPAAGAFYALILLTAVLIFPRGLVPSATREGA